MGLIMSKIDLTGQIFGRLTVIKEVDRNKYGQSMWECLCDCKNTTIVQGGSLHSGNTQSCGCLRKEKIKESLIKHGMCKTSTYNAWVGILQRCNNPRNQDYHNYGGRGIAVCDRWLKFENFISDMGLKPTGLTIDRINNNLGYFKENCRYASSIEQNRNRRVQKNNTTGKTGVHWNKQCQKYRVIITANNKQHHIGLFAKLEEAKIARKQAEQKYWCQK